MISELTPVRSRMLAVGLLIAVALGSYGFVVAPLAGRYQAFEDDIAELAARVSHLRRIASAGAMTEDRLAALKRAQPAGDYYLTSTKRALASAELQRHVKEIVNARGCQLVSSQVMSSEPEEGFGSVAVKVHMRGNIAGLQEVLHRLEGGKPATFIDDLSVSVTHRRRVPSRSPQGQMPLNIQFKVTAYGRGGEGEWHD